MITFYEDDFLKVTAREEASGQESNSVLLSFTGRGHAMGGIDVQKPEFFGAGRSFDNILFVTDKTRSWGNKVDFENLKSMTSPLVGNRKIYSIGNSLGGFNAILSTHHIPTEICIAFVPQFSVKPSIVPWEQRWLNYTSEIDEYRYETVAPYMNERTKYFLFSGGRGKDFRHARRFPVGANIYHYALDNTAHNVAKHLKSLGMLEAIIQNCFNQPEGPTLDVGHVKLSPADT